MGAEFPLRIRTRLFRWIPALLWMGWIFFLSARPDLPHAPEPWLDVALKKAGHALLYGVLARLYLYALGGPRPPSPPRGGLAWFLTLLYAISDEVHQAFVPGRTPSIWDVLIDGIGGGLPLPLSGCGDRKARLPVTVRPYRGSPAAARHLVAGCDSRRAPGESTGAKRQRRVQ